VSTRIQIKISEQSSDEVIHKFRNFGEDIYRSLHDICEINLKEIDSSTSNFTVSGIKSRDLGKVTDVIKKEIKRHKFENTVCLSRL